MEIRESKVQEFWRVAEPRTLEERVYLFLHEEIVSGHAAPGSTIVGSQVAAGLGVSRITVTNALRRLSSEGFVIIYPHRGSVVASLDVPTLEEIFRIRYALESEVMSELASNIDAEALLGLQELDGQVRESLLQNDIVAYRQLERRFHLLVYELSGLSIISSMLTDLWNRLEPYRGRRYTSEILVRDAIDDHQRILAALASHNADAAVWAMKTHVERGHQRLRDVVSPEGPVTNSVLIASGPETRVSGPVRRDLSPSPGSLRKCLESLPDTRRGQGRMYSKEAILTLTVCAMLCGARSGYAVSSWIAGSSLQIRSAVAWPPERVPSSPTIHRVISSLQPGELDQALLAWLANNRFTELASDPIQRQRGVHGEHLPGVEIIDGLVPHLHTHLQTVNSRATALGATSRSSWNRFFGRLLYGTEMPSEATPAELQLRMAFLHTMGRSMP